MKISFCTSKIRILKNRTSNRNGAFLLPVSVLLGVKGVNLAMTLLNHFSTMSLYFPQNYRLSNFFSDFVKKITKIELKLA